MRRRHKIDIRRALFLQFEKDAGQCGIRNIIAKTQLADLVVLAKHASQVAVREENRPRSARAHQRRFFTKMERRGCIPHVEPVVRCGLAHARRVIEACRMAAMPAQAALAQQGLDRREYGVYAVRFDSALIRSHNVFLRDASLRIDQHRSDCIAFPCDFGNGQPCAAPKSSLE